MVAASGMADEPLLRESDLSVGEDVLGDADDGSSSATTFPSAAVTRRLYISHFLSTFNSRVFEFGAVIFVAKVFPNTLLPISTYALARAAAAVGLSSTVGHYIDHNDRLKVVRMSIGMNIPLAASHPATSGFIKPQLIAAQ